MYVASSCLGIFLHWMLLRNCYITGKSSVKHKEVMIVFTKICEIAISLNILSASVACFHAYIYGHIIWLLY